MTDTPEGWTFTDTNTMDWQSVSDDVSLKMLGLIGNRAFTLSRFDAGHSGKLHHHENPEFLYVLEGDLVSQGVEMAAGHAYAAAPGTTHDEFRTTGGCTVLVVFTMPS
jgi:quercetin dioxygenase-like cupin family protein